MAADSTIRDRTMAVASAVVLVVDVTALVALATMAFFNIPSFRRVFADMGVALPLLTTFVLAIPPIVYVVLSILLAMALIVKEFLVRPVIRLVINIVALPPIVFTAIALIMALVLPLLRTMQAMGS
jgi:hypothetical protein